MGLVPQRINADPIPRARLRRAAEKPIARTRAANTALPRPSAPETEPSDWSADVPALRRQLLAWWQAHGRRDIPWKLRRDGSPPDPGEDLDPYGVFVAEVMLQQTQVAVMRPYWLRWMGAVPSLEALAATPEQDLLLLWQGLGYYARARRLRQAAQQLWPRVQQGSGAYPRQLLDWQALPGLGRSTAASIVSSAFDQPEAILDGNVRRVLARLVAAPRPPARDLQRFWLLSETLLDRHRPRDFNQALMDLGATVCTPRQPSCEACPWVQHCAAYAAEATSRFPVQEPRAAVPFQVIGVGVVCNADGAVLIDQRLPEGLLGGLWEFPGGKQEPGEPIASTIVRELREELAIEVEVGEELIVLEHAYSHKRLRFVVHLCRWLQGEPQALASQQVRWVQPAELDEFPFPAANARIIAALRQKLGAA